MAAPTRMQGVFDPAALSSTILYDALETVPELQPGLLATRTYAHMRRDSRLAAILSGYTMQIRRASWQLEPGGCRPEVVQVVADDMGLPVAGNDTPTAARTRGVSWNDHLRTAMLSLPFGFSTFELLAQLVDGKARLVALSPRLPITIEMIHADPATGDLLGVSQTLPINDATPQIKADRIAHYVHDPEGTLSGTSLLRPSYAPWFLKQELMRVHATSARRFGMGVPTVEWAPGSTPTPTQVSQAQQLASAARVGETAGASLPPGASLILRGLSGGVPDVLAYMKWLDQQMAGASLMQHLDLGLSESGSRALGTAFIDSWVLALGSVAEEITDVATRQVAARIVGWNWGPDEQVPRVIAAGVGTQRDVTAESLQQLLASGALSADPALEAWVRREYRLPEREGMAQPAPSVQGDTVAAANRRKPRKRATPPGQTALPVAAAATGDATPDYAQIQQEWDTARTDLLEQWPDLATPIVDALVASAGVAVDGGALATLGSLTVDAVTLIDVTAALADAMATLADSAAGHARTELAALGQQVDDGPDQARIDALAAAFAAQIAAGYAQAAGRKALAIAGAAGFAALLTAFLAEIGSATTGLVADAFGSALSAAQNTGRAAVLSQATGVRWRASEHNDASQCEPCRSENGKTYSTWAEAEAAYPMSGFSGCLGGSRCRGQLRAELA